MKDLIDRQAALDCFHDWIDKRGDIHTPDEMAEYRAIEALPPVQLAIIRCKDCKHYQFADNRAFGMPVKMCEWFGFEDVDDDDFCSRAEMREE